MRVLAHRAEFVTRKWPPALAETRLAIEGGARRVEPDQRVMISIGIAQTSMKDRRPADRTRVWSRHWAIQLSSVMINGKPLREWISTLSRLNSKRSGTSVKGTRLRRHCSIAIELLVRCGRERDDHFINPLVPNISGKSWQAPRRRGRTSRWVAIAQSGGCGVLHEANELARAAVARSARSSPVRPPARPDDQHPVDPAPACVHERNGAVPDDPAGDE